MADGGITAALLVASAAATAGGLVASRSQKKLDLGTLEAETERAKLVASEEALTSARTFRGALSSQLAISAMRSGAGGSLVRQFGAESFSNFLEDQRAIKSKQKFIDISSDLRKAQAKSNRFSRDVSGLGQLIGQGLGAINLNKTSGGASK